MSTVTQKCPVLNDAHGDEGPEVGCLRVTFKARLVLLPSTPPTKGFFEVNLAGVSPKGSNNHPAGESIGEFF